MEEVFKINQLITQLNIKMKSEKYLTGQGYENVAVDFLIKLIKFG